MKDAIPKLWVTMTVSQVSQRVEGGALLGLPLPDLQRFHADNLFGGNGDFSATDEEILKSILGELAEHISSEILRRGISGVSQDPIVLEKRGLEYALDDYGYRAVLEQYAPELLEA